MSQNGPVSMIMTSTMEQVISQAVTSNGTNNEQAPTSSHEQSLTHPTEAEASSNPSAQHSAAETPVRRGPGRPKGSGKKGRDPIAILEGRRPVGRPRKDGLPAGSFLPTKERKSAGRPRKSAPGAIGTNTMQSSTGQFRHAPYERNAPNSVQNFFSTPPQANGPAPWQAVYSSLGGGGKQSVVPPMASLQGDLVNPLDPELEKADWSSIVHSKPNSFMRVLLASLTSSSLLPVSGLSVEDAFRSHLVSLTPKDGDLGSIPSLYSIMKTFWLPSSPAYFSLTASASTTRIPSEHRFLYWDPQPLVFNGISCPTCSAPLTNRGRIGSGPIKIYDLGKPFYIIGCEYHCTSASCTHNGTTEGRKFASTDTRILRSLPDALRNEFPARLLQGDQGVGGDLGSGSHVWNWQALGVSVALYKMVKECLKAGLARDAILGVIHGVQYGAPDDVWNREEEEEDAEHDEEQPQDKTVANHISDPIQPYYTAWRANTAVAEPAPTVNGNASQAQAHPSPQSQPQQPQQPLASSSSTPVPTPVPNPAPVSAPVQVQPFTYAQASQFYPYQYNTWYQAATPIPAPTAPVGHGHGSPSAPTTTIKRFHASTIGSSSGPDGGPPIKRVRHCCKCGSQDCKGKGGRAFCSNPCQDCGKMDCQGRNSKRPDKICSDAWP